MTYLEKYLEEHNCTRKDFLQHQEDYDGFAHQMSEWTNVFLMEGALIVGNVR